MATFSFDMPIHDTDFSFSSQSSSSSCSSLSRLASSCLMSSASFRSLSLRISLSSCAVEADSALCCDMFESDGSMFVSCAAAGFRIDEIGLGRCGAGVVGFSSISSVALKLRFRGEGAPAYVVEGDGGLRCAGLLW